MKFLRATLGVVLGLLLACLTPLMICNAITQSYGARCTPRVGEIPANRVALVLGTSKYLRGHRLNTYYCERIEAAVALYKAGKAEFLLVSGDNRTSHYNEPTTMKRDLIAAGVPKERIYCDFAGFRTLDSVVRAKEIFGQTRLTIISQRFHNERALYLAAAEGIDAVGFDASNTPQQGRALLREKLACVQAVLDAQFLHKRPRFLGERISIQ